MYQADPEFTLRNLNGNVDEFAVFSGALSAAEIKQYFFHGTPNEL